MGLIYENNGRKVEKRWWGGLRMTTSTGHIVKPDHFISERILSVMKSLNTLGHDMRAEPPLNTAFWEYILDLRESDDGSLLHRAEATFSSLDVAMRLIDEAYSENH